MAENNKEDDKKNNNEKSPNKKSSTINYNLIGLIIISVAAFFGFGAIFGQMQLNIGAQASSAAFAALFIILSTKFLMEKESENKLLGEKQFKVFDANLEDYTEASQKMLNIMENNKITQTEINGLMHSYADLIILGDDKAINAFKDFIEQCQFIFSEGENYKNEGRGKGKGKGKDIVSHSLFVEGRYELWEQIVKFQLASREGLALPMGGLDETNLIDTFKGLIQNQENIESKKVIELSVEDWLLKNSTLKKNDEDFENVKKNTQDLIKKIKSVGLKELIKPTQISFRNPNHKTSARVIYLNNYAPTTKKFRMSFNGATAKENHEFFKYVETELKDFDSKIRSRGGKFDVQFYVNSENMNAAIIPQMLKEYMEKFHK